MPNSREREPHRAATTPELGFAESVPVNQVPTSRRSFDAQTKLGSWYIPVKKPITPEMIATGKLPEAEFRALSFSLPVWFGSEQHPKYQRFAKLISVLGFTSPDPVDLVWQLLGGDVESHGMRSVFTTQQLELLTNPSRLHHACQTTPQPIMAVQAVELDGVTIPHGDFDSAWRASLVALALLTEHIPYSGFGQLVDFLYANDSTLGSLRKKMMPLDQTAEYFTEKIGFLHEQLEQKNHRQETGELKEITTLEEWVASFGQMTTLATLQLEQQPKNKQLGKAIDENLRIPKQFLNNKRYQVPSRTAESAEITKENAHVAALNKKLSLQLQQDLLQARSQIPFTSLNPTMLVQVLTRIHQGTFDLAAIESLSKSIPKLAQQPLESLTHEQIVLILSSEMELLSRPPSGQNLSATESTILELAQQLHTQFGMYYINGTFGSEHTALSLHGVFGADGVFNWCLIHTPIQFDLMSNALVNLQNIPLLAQPLMAPALAAPGWSLASLASPLGLLGGGLLASARLKTGPTANTNKTPSQETAKKPSLSTPIAKPRSRGIAVFAARPKPTHTRLSPEKPRPTAKPKEMVPKSVPNKKEPIPKKNVTPRPTHVTQSLSSEKPRAIPKQQAKTSDKPKSERLNQKNEPGKKVESPLPPLRSKTTFKTISSAPIKEKPPQQPKSKPKDVSPAKPRPTHTHLSLEKPRPKLILVPPQRRLELTLPKMVQKKWVAASSTRHIGRNSETKTTQTTKETVVAKTTATSTEKKHTVKHTTKTKQQHEEKKSSHSPEKSQTAPPTVATTSRPVETIAPNTAKNSESPLMQAAQVIIGGSAVLLSKGLAATRKSPESVPAPTTNSVIVTSPESRRRRGKPGKTAVLSTPAGQIQQNQPLQLAVSSLPTGTTTKKLTPNPTRAQQRRSLLINPAQSILTADSFSTARMISNWLKTESLQPGTHRSRRPYHANLAA